MLSLETAIDALSLKDPVATPAVLLILEKSSCGDSVSLSIRPAEVTGRTAIVMDDRVLAHRNPVVDHPECPERVPAVWQALRTGGMVPYCTSVPARLVTRAEVELVHEMHHW